MTKDFTTDTILKDVDDQGICTITLNRPDALNAMDGELVDFLWHHFYEMAYEPDVRVVILTGAGERSFCVGADLKERKGMDAMQVRKRIDDYGRCFEAIDSLPKPVICAINGFAFGGGLELALACDLRLMSTQAKVGLTELKLGIIPGAGGTQRLPRLIGAARAKQMIFTGERLNAERALEMGVINEACAPDDLMPRAHALATMMLDSAPIALAQAKLAIDAGLGTDLRTGLKLESRAYAVTIPTKDRIEGLEAFAQKRKPNFKGH